MPDGQAGFVVPDTLGAYLALGALARSRVRGPVIAITGSTGKTTTKAFTVRTLEAGGRAATATPENENNEIGVAKFLLSLEDNDERVVVVEFGARKYRDLEPLVAAAKPNIGVLTNIGEAHLEIMGSRERLAETKWGLFAGGARPVLNLADDASRERAATLNAEPVWFGIDAERPPGGARAAIVRVDDVLAIAGGEVRALPLHVDVPGDYNRRNMAAAFAAAWAAGVDPAAVTANSPHFELPHGRYERMSIAGGPTVIYDAYNASMSGALATLAAFARERVPARRIVVLGSMAELGPEAPLMHQRVGAAAAASADIVLVGGAFADSLAGGRTSDGARGRHADHVCEQRRRHRVAARKRAPRRHRAAQGLADVSHGADRRGADGMIPQRIHEPSLPDGLVAVPVRTRLIVKGDDLVAVLRDALHGLARPGDVVAIAETAVAIAQGRFIGAETIRPSRLARVLARRAGALATINQPESLQLVIDQVGAWRVFGAAVLQVAGRAVGRRGVFYELLGEAIAAIDGYTGTLPPYERAIVLGPADPDRVSTELAAALDLHVAIVDANDLRRAKALGASPRVVRDSLEKALLGNPAGNGDEQTPLVILAWRGEGPHPLVQAA